MLLVVDIGNSSTKLGVFEGDRLVSRIAIKTKRKAGASYISDEIDGRLTQPIESAVIASVVPEMEQPVREYLQLEHNIDPLFVDHSFDLGLKVNYEPLTAVGIDRLVNASAAASIYGTPCIVCSFGTATTIDAVSADGQYLGGVIAPGMQTMAKALHLAASKLPEIEIEKPDVVLGTTTAGSIRSGIFFGYTGMVGSLIERVANNADRRRKGSGPNIVATGGFAYIVAAEISAISAVNENLTLEGLRLLFEKMSKRTSAETSVSAELSSPVRKRTRY